MKDLTNILNGIRGTGWTWPKKLTCLESACLVGIAERGPDVPYERVAQLIGEDKAPMSLIRLSHLGFISGRRTYSVTNAGWAYLGNLADEK